MPEPEGPALSTVKLSPGWGYTLASQVVTGEVFRVTRTLALCTWQLQDRVNHYLQCHQDAC